MEVSVNRSSNTVSLGTAFLTTKLDLSSMDPMVMAVIYNTETGKGTKFFSEEAMVDGYLKPQETIYGPEYRQLVGPIVDLAMKHWEARKNPYVMYRINSDGGFVGQRVKITTYPHPTETPEGFTTIESPNPDSTNPMVQWTGTQWIEAPWKFSDDVAIQKEDLRNHLLALVAAFINNQLRIHSMYDIIESGGTLRPADSRRHGHTTMESYISEIKGRIQARLELIDGSRTTDDLLQISFNVDDLFQ